MKKKYITDEKEINLLLHKTPLWLQPGCFSIIRQIQSEMFLRCFLNLKTSSDNSIPDQATVKQEKGCSGFERYFLIFA